MLEGRIDRSVEKNANLVEWAASQEAPLAQEYETQLCSVKCRCSRLREQSWRESSTQACGWADGLQIKIDSSKGIWGTQLLIICIVNS